MSICAYCRLPASTASIQKIPSDVVKTCRNRSGPCSACQKLLDIELKIDEARRALQILLEEKRKLASVLNEHHDPFIHRLPVEIVSRIFVHCLPYSPSLHVFDDPGPFNEQEHIEAVFNLGQITRNWRNIAWHTPALWTVFSATITENNCINSIAIAQDWLRRSRQLDLFIELRVDESKNEVVSQAAQQFVAAITLHAHRWKVFDVCIPRLIVPALSSAVSHQKLDRLEHLVINLDTDEASMLQLPCSPRLLTVDGGWLHHTLINWDKLTQFSSPPTLSFAMYECVYLFTTAPALLSCTFGAVHGDSNAPRGIPLVCDQLQVLKVGTCDAQFWETFSFSSLNTLHFTRGSGGDYWNQCRDFLRRSNCPIKVLFIAEEEEVEGDGVLEFLELLPQIEHLDIQGEVLDGNLLSRMHSASSSDLPHRFLPALRSLRFSDSVYLTFDWPALVAMLVTRKSMGAPLLEFVHVQYNFESSDEYIGALGDKRSFKLLLDAVCELEFQLLDVDGADVLEKLRRFHDM